ncbi:MAG: hypothetical protein GWO11_01560 [Desulfuromonadales bacterium]|nr:hypothetical protein [Desulfuromonadales bacterium]NIR33184.1 hypothetical protein [Desulfuromonadales bacterium]
MIKKRHAWMMVPLLTLLLAGCGSSRDSDGAVATQAGLGVDPATGVAFVGTVACIECHEGFTWSSAAVNGWLEGKHAENHTSHYGYDYMSDNGCTKCHDPIGDSPEVREFKGGEDFVTMGCENCHGAGGEHYGLGPIPEPQPGIESCGQCHNAEMSHLSYHPEAGSIVENYKASRHFTATVRADGVCARCHTDEGGKTYKDVSTRDQLTTLVASVDSDEPVQCRTCHDPHKAGGLLFDDIYSHGHLVESGEYATCTSCHMKADAVLTVDATTGETDWDNTTLMYHDNKYYRIIADTHYDDPDTAQIEGYVVKATGERSCRDCHNVHTVQEIKSAIVDGVDVSTDTINDRWSKSGHGGHIGEIKLAAAGEDDKTAAQTEAVMAAGVTDADAAAWVHYDWDGENRQTCQRCHTATGAKNYLSDPANYDPASNDFSHLAGWSVDATTGAVTSSGQNEMLYCWGCHSDNAGGLFAPGAVTAEYADAGGAAVSFPDIDKSNVCVACHSGRLNGQYIKDNFAAVMAGSGRKDQGVFNSHYLAAAGIIYTEIGYEFDGLDYENGYYKHDDIGTVDAEGNEAVPGTGTAGPCVGCHMTDAGHSLAALAADGGGNDVCSACHVDLTAEGGNDYTLYPSVIDHERAGFENTMLALNDLLATNKGIYVNSASGYPYVFNTGVVADQDFSTAFTDWGAEQDLGSAFNLVMLEHEPGAYAHNRKYAKRLLFDSIDWVDNGILDGIIDLSDPAYAEAVAWLTHYSGDPATAITRAGL